jgi:hypothetical protein
MIVWRRLGGAQGARGELVRTFAAALAAAVALMVAPAASAYVYWTNQSAVGRAGLDGSSPNEKFVAASRPCSVALNPSHIFWATKNAIYTGSLNGAGGHQLLSTEFGTTHTCPLAIAATHLFWNYFASQGRGGLSCYLARVNTNGHSLKKTYINEGSLCESRGIVASGSFLYYLAEVTTVQTLQLAIVRVPLSGGRPHVLYHQRLDVASAGIVAAGGHLYWDNGSHIGRLNLNGGNPQPEFIRKTTAGTQGSSCGLAVAGGRLYWADASYRRGTEVYAIDSAALNGSSLNYKLLAGLKYYSCVQAADGLGPPP